jgi:pilus assembly protein CpaB
MGRKKLLILALICATGASSLVYRFLKSATGPKAIEIPKANLVFARTTIPARTQVAAEQLEVRQVPREAVAPDMVQKVEEIVGLIAKTEIIQGEPVNINRLFRKGDQMGLSSIIPEGMRAITIPIDEIIGVAGFVKPGEKVDLIGTMQPQWSKESISWTLLQDIEVLAVSQEMGVSNQGYGLGNSQSVKAKVGTSVTLAVTPVQAEKIVLSKEKGALHLTLRPVLKEAEQDIPAVRESNLIPGDKPRSASGKKKSTKQVIEVINGAKSKFVTVN